MLSSTLFPHKKNISYLIRAVPFVLKSFVQSLMIFVLVKRKRRKRGRVYYISCLKIISRKFIESNDKEIFHFR